MTSEDLKQRTKNFAPETARFSIQWEHSIDNKANYSAVRRAGPKADFINKLKIVEGNGMKACFSRNYWLNATSVKKTPFKN
jgi:hypothetical protein